MGSADDLRAFLEGHPHCAVVEVARARGSTPREAGAWMLVSFAATLGTIGGGQLEWMAIDEARRLLRTAAPCGRGDGAAHVALEIPLGPEIGQCCGGRVTVDIRVACAAMRSELIAAARREDATRPHVILFGGGHVGRALVAGLSLLPLRVIVVETRAAALEGLGAGVETRLTPVPEEAVRAAPPGSATIVLTHDHALDFLLAAEALGRGDFAYVGMIGSKTKRATFRRWFLAEAGGTARQFASLVCPIGGDAVRDKRPAVIAALAAAEVVTALARGGAVGSEAEAAPRAGASS